MNDLSKWHLSAEGKVMRQGWADHNHPFRIVHLDDHKLFRTGVKDYCIHLFFPKANIIGIENGDAALDYILTSIDTHEIPDLIITDINHPGLLGHEFVKKIRYYENIKGMEKRIPIIIITFMSPEIAVRLKKDSNFIIDKFLSKGDEACKIIECLDEILYK